MAGRQEHCTGERAGPHTAALRGVARHAWGTGRSCGSFPMQLARMSEKKSIGGTCGGGGKPRLARRAGGVVAGELDPEWTALVLITERRSVKLELFRSLAGVTLLLCPGTLIEVLPNLMRPMGPRLRLPTSFSWIKTASPISDDPGFLAARRAAFGPPL